MKKNDVILLVSLLLIFLGLFLFTDVLSFSKESEYEVHIRDPFGNVSVKQINEEGIFTVESEKDGFFNKYEIKDGKVNMLDSNCRDKLCVHMKPIAKDGEMIVCLPHKVYISVHKKKSSGNEKGNETEEEKLDAVSE